MSFENQYEGSGHFDENDITVVEERVEIEIETEVEVETEGALEKVGGNGGAVYVSGGLVTFGGSTAFNDNWAKGNGGAMGIYSNALVIMDGTSTFEGNTSTGNGGAIYVTGPSTIRIRSVVATDNSAKSGGFLYITTTDSAAYIYGGTIKNNGDTFVGNAAKSHVYLNKEELDTDYNFVASKFTLHVSIDEEWGAWEAND